MSNPIGFSDCNNTQNLNPSSKEESKKNQECNPQPEFQLPKKGPSSNKGIVPANLLRQVKEMRRQKGDDPGSLETEKNIDLSEELRKKRIETYFPSSGEHKEDEQNPKQ